MSDKRYHIIFSGKIKPHMDIDTVKANLALSLNLNESKLKRLFSGEEILLKHCSSIKEAERISERFEQSGALCLVRDTLSPKSNPVVEAGSESSLIRLLKSGGEEAGSTSMFTRLVSGFRKRKHG